MEQMAMRHATEAKGPLTVVLRDNTVPLRAVYIDGGGFDLDAGVYEVSVELLDGGHVFVAQDRIERVLDADGDEVEFGNPYLPGHPRPQELPAEDEPDA